MKVSISWLKELVDLNCTVDRLVSLLPLRSVSTKEVTDEYIELDMKGYNRADLLSIRGVAQEISAITGSRLLFNEPEEAKYVWNTQKLPNSHVEVKSPDLAPYYTITKIEGLSVGKSSDEIVKKLKESGIRSVDNITDVTNLIMVEYGQPLHAFDAEKVSGSIGVRKAEKEEKITTIDGKVRALKESDLVICDNNGPIGIAGIMGGKNSEVSDSTKTIYLEAGIFDPVNTRRTTVSLALYSEASTRFQHGLTKKRHNQALNAAIKMYESMGGKVTEVTMVGDFEDKVKKITLKKEKLESLVGVNFEDSKVEDYLKKLHFKPASRQSSGNVVWEVEVPYFRLDINIEEDIIEEVARMYGYEKIPAKEVASSKPLQDADPIFQRISDLRKKLVGLGLTEVQTYSFYSTDVQNALGFNESNKTILLKVKNPISSETEYLRQNIWPNLVEVVGKNIRKGYKDVAVFEIGKAFENIDKNPQENYRLSIALMNGSDNPLKELASIVKELGIEFKQVKPPSETTHFFHSNRFLAMEKDGKQIGILTEVHLRVLNKLGIESRIAVVELIFINPN